MKTVWFIGIILVLGHSAVASADDSIAEAQLRKIYVGTQQLLRHFYDADTLKFDSDGNPRNQGKEGPWTLLSDVSVDDLHLKSGKLTLYGHRNALMFDDQNKKLRAIRLDQAVWIEVELQDGADQNVKLAAALNQVFVAPRDLATAVPDYWRDYVARLMGNQGQGANCSNLRTDNDPLPQKDESVTSISSATAVGMKIHDVFPIYLPFARQARIEGQVFLKAVIDKSGNVSQLCISHALGAGLDDSAADAIRQWKYRPYMLNGKPMEVETDISVKFSIR
ncbi:MAG TPA: energy transducer TonB [Candidatus Angelobacter sp.]|jgi:TonB family protein